MENRDDPPAVAAFADSQDHSAEAEYGNETGASGKKPMGMMKTLVICGGLGVIFFVGFMALKMSGKSAPAVDDFNAGAPVAVMPMPPEEPAPAPGEIAQLPQGAAPAPVAGMAPPMAPINFGQADAGAAIQPLPAPAPAPQAPAPVQGVQPQAPATAVVAPLPPAPSNVAPVASQSAPVVTCENPVPKKVAAAKPIAKPAAKPAAQKEVAVTGSSNLVSRAAPAAAASSARADESAPEYSFYAQDAGGKAWLQSQATGKTIIVAVGDKLPDGRIVKKIDADNEIIITNQGVIK